MKRTTKRFMSAGVALALAAVTAFGGFGPAVAQAANSTPDEIKYVSLGDSMSNGYGLDGYNANTGTEDYGYASYANQFAEWLDADSHAQLAMSAMRAEDLHWLLEVDYDDPAVETVIDTLANNYRYYRENIEEFDALWYSVFTTGDYYTWRELINDYRFDIAAAYIENLNLACIRDNSDMTKPEKDTIYAHYSDIEALKVVAKYYQESVANADVISLGIGNGNFGVFTFGRIMEAIGFGGTPDEAMIYNIENAIQECDPELRAQLYTLLDEVEAILASKGITVDDGNGEVVSTMEALYNTLVYATISYALNYAGSVEAILQMNPDVEIIQVALMNTIKSNTTIEGDTTLGEVMDLLFGPLNVYIAALPTYMQATDNSVYDEATFYYAEAPYVECIVDTYTEGGLDPIVRDRFFQSIVKDDDEELGMVWGLLGNMVTSDFSLEDVEDYEGLDDAGKVAYAAQDASLATSISMYLAFENAIIKGKNNAVSVNSIMGLSDLFAGNPFGTIMNEFYEEAAVTGKSKIDVVAQFIADNSGNLVGKQDVIDLVTGGGVADKVYYKLVEAQGGLPEGSVVEIVNETERGKAYLYAMVEAQGGLPEGSVAEIVNETERGKAYLYAMVEAQGGLPEGSVAEIVNETERGKAYLYAMVEAQGGLPEGSVAGAVDEGNQEIINAVVAAKQTVEDGIATAKQTVEDGVTTAKQTVEDGVATAMQTVENMDIVNTVNSLCILLVMPEVLGDVVAESELSGLLALFARCVIGNGIGSHPSAIGHNALFEAVKSAYDEEYTSTEKTIDNVLYVITEYYDDAYAYAYQYAVDNGYVDEALAGLDYLDSELIKLETDLDSLLPEGTNPEFTDELKGSIDDAQETIAALKELIANADFLDQETLDKAIVLLEKLGENITDIRDLATIAGLDIANAAYDYYVTTLRPAIEEALKEAVEAGTAWLMEKAEEAYNAMVEAITEAAKEYAPEVADYIYNWLLENPDKVIAFFEEYGDDMITFMEDYQEEILMVLGFLVSEFGDDVANYVLENPEEVLDTLVWFYEEHGENTWKLIKTYADALGITAALEAQAEEVYKALEAICDYIEGEIAEFEDIIEAEIEKIEAEIEALKAELEKAGADAKAAIKAEIAKLEAELEALVDQLDAYLENAFNELYVDATTGEYVVDGDSKYLALGDSVAASKNSFAGKLADELAKEYKVDDYTDLSMAGFRAEDIRYILDETYELDAYGQAKTKAKADKIRADYIAAIEESDLITITLGNDNFSTFIADQIGARTYEMDWERYVTEDGVPYVEEKLAEIRAEVTKAIPNPILSKRVEKAVEAYAYGFAGFAGNYTQVLNEIHEINPDAQVVVVGMFNPMDALTMNVDGEDVALGEYVDYFISMSNQMFTVYSAITPNTTFVPVPDTEVVMDADVEKATYIDYVWNLLNASDELLPSDSGYTYIKDQIMKAMTITSGYLKGDVNLDGKVNVMDTSLLFDYILGKEELGIIQLWNGDANEDDDINVMDTSMIFDYILGKEVVGW